MRWLIAIVLLISMGCSDGQSEPQESSAEAVRMGVIQRMAIEKAEKPLHRSLLEQGTIFVDLADLEVPCVGVRVPLPDSSNRAFLSFTKEWFHSHTDEEVAASLLNDLEGVLSDLENSQRP